MSTPVPYAAYGSSLSIASLGRSLIASAYLKSTEIDLWLSSCCSFYFCSFVKCFCLGRCFCLSDGKVFWRWKLKELKLNLNCVTVWRDSDHPFLSFSCFWSCQGSCFRRFGWIICSYVDWRTGCFLNQLQFRLFVWFDRWYEGWSFPGFQVRDRRKCSLLRWVAFDQKLNSRVSWASRSTYHNLNWAYSAFPWASGQYWEQYSCRKTELKSSFSLKKDYPTTTSDFDSYSSRAVLSIQNSVAAELQASAAA